MAENNENQLTIPQQLEKLAAEVCDKVCHYTHEAGVDLTEEELYKICEECPMTRWL